MITLLLLVSLTLPNHRITPGVVRDLSLHTICTTKWGKDKRQVTERMRKEVFARYHIPWSNRSQYEVDHLVSRDIGGADAIENLWVQPIFEAKHYKDRLEVKMNKLVCTDKVSLKTAQESMRGNWMNAYRMYVGELP